MRKVLEWKRRRILCPECRVGRKKEWWNWEEAVYPTEEKAQQDSIQTELPKGTAREGGEQRDLRRTFKMLREIWLNIGVEKIDTHKRTTVKALLDSRAIGVFMDRKIAAKHSFRLQKLERPLIVKNIDGIYNSGEAITHQVEMNVYYKNYVERMKIDVYDLEKTDIILEMPWLQVYDPEINWETGEVKMMRCSLLCRRNTKEKEDRKIKKGKRVATLEEEKIIRQTVDNKEDWGKEEEIEADYRKIKEMVPRRFLKWKKVFGKVESERIPTRKIQDHAIDLKETFKPQKRKIYPLSKDKREEVQNFVNDQLRKRYIRLLKFPQTSPVFFVSKKDRSKRIVMDY